MTPRTRNLLIWGCAVVAVTAFLAWVGNDFRPDGILGFIQNHGEWLYVFPYLLGTVLGGTAHSPSDEGYVLGLLLEIILIAFLLRLIIGRFAAGAK